MSTLSDCTPAVKPVRKSRKVERTMSYDALVGVLYIDVKTGNRTEHFAYWLDRNPHADAVRLTKFRSEGETDGELYDVELTKDGATCDCKGHTRWSHCKHADAISALRSSGKI